MDRAFRPLPLLLVAAALLAGCQGARPAEPSAAPVAGPVVFQNGAPAGGPQAVASGVLSVDAQGCLRLGERALVWPSQAALDIAQPGVVRVYSRGDGAAVRVGEPVALLLAPAAPVQDARCPGARWAVTRFMPADG